MSRRAAEMLRDDLEAGGPVKLSEVEAAQKDIVFGCTPDDGGGHYYGRGDGWW